MTTIPSVSLSWLEAGEALRLVMQTLTTISCLWAFASTCLAPLPANENDPKELKNLLVPPHNVLRVCMRMLQCFQFNVLVAPKATTGSFVERYSTGGEDKQYLNLATFVANISMCLWVLFALLDWGNLAIIAFGFMWCGSLPMYLALNHKRPRVNTCRDALIISCEQISVRFYFTWLTGAAAFGLLDIAQYIHGSIFNYNIYAGVMVGMLVLVFVTYAQTRDSIVCYMAVWFLGQIISREGAFEGDDESNETFEKLLHVANIMWPVIFLTMAIDYPLAEARRERNGMNSSSDEEETGYGTL